MATDPQDAPRHAGQVVRRVLRRRNIAIDAETAQLVAAAAQTALRAVRPPGSRAEGRVFLPPAASGCSDMAAATRLVWAGNTFVNDTNTLRDEQRRPRGPG